MKKKNNISKFPSPTENTRSADNFPLIDLRIPLSMFFKQSVTNGLLYTSVQPHELNFIVSDPSTEMYKSNSFQLFYVLSGQVRKCIENMEYTFLAGQGCILNRFIAHSDLITNGHLLILNISESFMKDILSSLDQAYSQQPILRYLNQFLNSEQDIQKNFIEFSSKLPIESHVFRTLLDNIQLELSSDTIGASFFQKGLILRLLYILQNPEHFNLNIINIDINKEDFLVNRLTTLIEASHGNISRDEIKAILHYHPEYLNRLLKKKYKQSISNYSKTIRIQKAQQLLIETNLTISSIAEALFFSSEQYFYNFFKKMTGYSPKQYRLKFQKIDVPSKI
ncbi:helix-turn-helix transcriptional regulator [Aerococcaceae bacterium zg-ZUI334]|uniref:helix-turn-helix transcriptional regulator n=1 Tax=Aerococcaceae TaxID=186827 RepID=UPI0013BC47E6|nr:MULTISPECIES: helix-turn-helix transcriptional regulator [unclassified Facklamia]MBR7928008.1 helix-turn-helix transcriptional regulator [Aerococcaceae bacterium zg-ZUI334]MBS4461130.1 helix-turn-helix transcriptional regulator [Aerococcaceae bacterium zg-B36]QQD64840.1 helix-turn-helix transcriptional regulator [Aerococcaceae bacterium zg-252]NEW64379.1 helix-turn-helix domain-containing protein [Facklamia sp. 252]NEW67784.1 helix-turn-helix domain-containing protein [Facklamia sp. 253]